MKKKNIATAISMTAIALTAILFMTGVFVPEHQRIAREVAAGHEYISGEYDCTEFSEELVKRLRAAGYEARTVVSEDVERSACIFTPEAWKEMTGEDLFCHRWVEVVIPIEATTGQVIDPKTYAEVYKS